MGTSSSEAEPTEDEGVLEADSPLDDPAYRDRLGDMPPSAKLVVRTLHDDAPLATWEITDRSLLPTRTARYAITRLEEAGLVEARQDLRDGRRQVYILTSPTT